MNCELVYNELVSDCSRALRNNELWNCVEELVSYWSQTLRNNVLVYIELVSKWSLTMRTKELWTCVY